MKKALPVMLSTIIAVSTTLPSNIAYADSLGKITANASIQCDFAGDIYLIIKDTEDNRKLILLSSSNDYQAELTDLNAGTYKIAEVHIYDTDSENESGMEELTNANYTLEYENLTISEANQTPTIAITLHEKEESSSKDVIEEDDDIESETTIESSKYTTDVTIDDSEEIEKEKENQSIKRRKTIYFVNFIIDAFLIIGLGTLWFFKVKRKQEDED